ncbi:MAG: hypothetical protein PHU51_02940, partial [Candidatus Nanoarchaeia archaeon]|nr:hypothetical protein [Candidatus Nanoarchaeia archaeon]
DDLLRGIMRLGNKRRMITSELVSIFNHSKIFKDAFPDYFFIPVQYVDYRNELKKIRSKNESLFLNLGFKLNKTSSFFSNIFPENFKLYGENIDDFELSFLFRHKGKNFIYVNIMDDYPYYDTGLVYKKDENIHNFKVSKLTFFREPFYRHITGGYPKVENLFGGTNYGFDKPLNISLFDWASNNLSSSCFEETMKQYNSKIVIMGKIDLNSGSPLKNMSKSINF